MDRNNTVSQETCCIPAGVITEPDVSLQLEGKAYKDFSLKRVISSWRDRLFCPAEMQQFSARCREHVLTGHVSLIFSCRSPLLSDWWRVRYSDGGTGTHSWSVMFGGPIGGSTAKANNNSALMLDTRVKCAMMCSWRRKPASEMRSPSSDLYTPRRELAAPRRELAAPRLWWWKHPGVISVIRRATTIGNFLSLSRAPFESRSDFNHCKKQQSVV